MVSPAVPVPTNRVTWTGMMVPPALMLIVPEYDPLPSAPAYAVTLMLPGVTLVVWVTNSQLPPLVVLVETE